MNDSRYPSSDADPAPDAFASSHPYPTLRLIGRHGEWIAALVGAAPLAAALWAAVAGYSPAWLAAGLAGAVLAYGLARSYVELVRLISDMLMPR